MNPSIQTHKTGLSQTSDTPDTGRRALLRTGLLGAGLLLASAAPLALAEGATPLKVYGPGGPAPAMHEAATAFEKATGISVEPRLSISHSAVHE
ncbi:MAG: hypothetical protein ACP5NM_06660 [Thiomonas sp.]